ncbi:hypothetical protein [Nitrosomonas sp.]|uniref:hypothetical protein n=1 Tax=Nitrosomonas sp. TaxID=42353 RepID=UPI002080E33A|nr:hypothetical protein [Nitrosomonas sp.]GJL75966.1 MAG: hypothetical protein NMNS02_20720 [Nitrosomonas sp.]
MAANDNNGGNASLNREVSPRTTSFAGRHPELVGDMPVSFRSAPSSRQAFDHAREHIGRGSEMVKQDKPFPELRPKYEQAPIREAFNRAWLREQRESRLVNLDRQREERLAMERSEHAMQSNFELKAQEQRMPER